MLITSLDNKKIKLINKLNERKFRHELGLFVVEGEHLINEALNKKILKEVIVLNDIKVNIPNNIEITYVTSNIMKKITQLPSVPRIIGICYMKENNNILGNRILILEDIQDPGNLGTIIRSAKAFSIDTIVLSTNTVDIYNDKVIRSTQGMLFDSNIMIGDLNKVINDLRSKGYLILGTDVNNGEDVRGINCKKYALVMGNEGNGLSSEIKALCDKQLYIKMNDACESLNVGVATSILLYELECKHE